MSALPGEQRTRLRHDLAVVPVRSPTLPPATHTNCWLLGRDRLVVVDPASPWAEPQQALLDGLLGRPVRAVFLTHHHPDHTSGLAELVRQTGAEVWAHPQTASRVRHRVDRLVQDGEILDLDGSRWTALHTPGHAPGHLCLLDEEGTVVAGDMVAGTGTIVLDPPEGHLGQYLASLQRLSDLGAERLLPAHGPVIEDGQALLAEYIAHRHQRSDQVRSALARRAPARPLDLVPDIYPELPALFHPVAARQVLCHLQWLDDQGEARPAATPAPDGGAPSGGALDASAPGVQHADMAGRWVPA